LKLVLLVLLGVWFPICCWRSGCYVVETKLGAESKLMNSVLRLYDYSKFAQARGAFAILFPEELEDIFGGKSVFENISQYEEGRYPVEQMREAATYLLINQLLFYHVLSIDTSFPGLDKDKIERLSDLAGYFEPVLKRNYSYGLGCG